MSRDDTEGLRPSLKPWLVGLGINLLLGAALLGIPYMRGPDRAAEVTPRFAAFAACFYDAEPLDPPGLGLPRGERGRYGSLVLDAPPDWPRRCAPLLEAIPPEESIFLFPGVKNAEAQLRAAVALMGQELEGLQERRDEGVLTVSHRPMRAMAALRGALAELGLSSGVETLSASRDAVRFAQEDQLATPSIIPLRVSRGGEWRVVFEDGALLAGTMDSRAAVHVRVADGGVEQRVTRRPRLVSGMLAAREPPWVLWSTSPSQCADSEEGCARRSSGLAAFLEDRQTLEPMVWVQAHPAFRPSAAIHVQGTTAWVVATAPEEGAEVRRFALPEPEVRPLGEEREVPRVSADAAWTVAPPRAGAWLPGEPPWVLLAAGDGLEVLRLTPDATPTRLEGLGPAAVVETCGDASAGWLVAAAGHGARAVQAPSGTALEVGAVHLDPPQPGALDVECEGPAAWIVGLDRGRVEAVRCVADGCGAPITVVEEGARTFDAVRHRGALLVAWTDDPEAGPVRLTRLDDGSEPETSLPAPCWTDPQDGLCGEARLASDGDSLVLVTRQEEDLRVLSSEDGRAFETLTGLEQP